MLTRENRLTSSQLFTETVRRGHRSGSGTVVLHLHLSGSAVGAPRVGFVVSKAVGPAVTRNLVKRRLRHLARERLAKVPGSAVLVVRALPAAATASCATLAADLDAALEKTLRRAQR